jgi:hypothetical protein
MRGAAEAGATWWTESIGVEPLAEIRACVAAGPLRIE